MKGFWERLKARIIRFMQGRHGPDELSMYTMILAIILSLVFSFTGLSVLYIVFIALWVWCLFRMFSRQLEKRNAENRRFLEWMATVRRESKAFFLRLKNARVYKYFRCPGCKARMRLKRGSGEKDITCPRCGKTFHMKA